MSEKGKDTMEDCIADDTKNTKKYLKSNFNVLNHPHPKSINNISFKDSGKLSSCRKERFCNQKEGG